jgi:hypothetical protein
MTTPPRDCYADLGNISHTASVPQITAALRLIMIGSRDDKPPAASEKRRKAREAAGILSNDKTRKAHDAVLFPYLEAEAERRTRIAKAVLDGEEAEKAAQAVDKETLRAGDIGNLWVRLARMMTNEILLNDTPQAFTARAEWCETAAELLKMNPNVLQSEQSVIYGPVARMIIFNHGNAAPDALLKFFPAARHLTEVLEIEHRGRSLQDFLRAYPHFLDDPRQAKQVLEWAAEKNMHTRKNRVRDFRDRYGL